MEDYAKAILQVLESGVDARMTGALIGLLNHLKVVTVFDVVMCNAFFP